jgi:hypothetical protein
MSGSMVMDSDGTVEISDLVYRCLVGALRTIAEGSDACCSEHARRRNRHSSSCAVGIARAAFKEADRLDSLPNSFLDRPDE